MPANHNFHVNCPRKWHYSGDVSIEYGGQFFHAGDIQDGDDLVRCISVQRSGVSNQWVIRAGQVFLGQDGERLLPKEKLAEEFGWALDDLETRSAGHTLLRVLQVEQVYSNWGFEEGHQIILQLGKNYDPLASESDRYPEPDYILQHNARVENWLRNNILRTW